MPIFEENFIDNRNEWPVQDDERKKLSLGTNHYIDYYIVNRHDEVGHSIIWKGLNIDPVSPIQVTTTIRRRSGGNHGYGIIWQGKDKENCHALEISGSGHFKVKQRVNGSWKALTNWMETPFIKRETGTNTLTITQKENEVVIEINHIEVHRAKIALEKETAGVGFTVYGKLQLEIQKLLVTYYNRSDEIEAGASGDDQAEKSEITGINTIEPPEEESLQDVMDELNELIGMDNIKEEINTLINVLKVQKIRSDRGMKTTDLSLHMVLAGPPGTGKTTVARLIGRIYHALGFLDKGHVVETDRAGLVAQYVGQTAPKVAEVVDEALGGILFIDEAYSLMPSDGGAGGRDFGQEAIEALLKRMEDKRGEFALIIAGYSDEMHRFLDANSGVRSRFNRYLYFEHYNPEELTGIYELFANKGGFDLTDGARNAIMLHMTKAYNERNNAFGNGRYARNLFEDTIEKQANRIVGEDKDLDNESDSISDEALKTFTKDDIPEFKSQIELTPEEVAELLKLELEPPENKPETELVSIEETPSEETPTEKAPPKKKPVKKAKTTKAKPAAKTAAKTTTKKKPAAKKKPAEKPADDKKG